MEQLISKSKNPFEASEFSQTTRDVMEDMHATLLRSHLMFDKTIVKVRNRYFWPFMRTQVHKFISTATHPHRTPRAPLQPIQTQVKRTFELVTTDFIGPLKRSRHGNINIVVICDQKSKYAWFRAMRTQDRHLEPVLVKIQMEFDIFEQLLSDRGPNYESHLIAQMCEMMDTLKRRTTPYHAMVCQRHRTKR